MDHQFICHLAQGASAPLLPEPAQRLAQRHAALRVLVVGGSLGAHALNTTVPAAMAQLSSGNACSVRHQTGKADQEAVRQAYAAAGVDAQVSAFIDDMAAAYAWADLVICRSGALTVAELAVVGVAAILVPYPHATDDHQTGNARFLADAGAAILVPQDTLDPQRLGKLLDDLTTQREVLLEMACRAHSLALPQAARRVAELCMQAAGFTAPPAAGEGTA